MAVARVDPVIQVPDESTVLMFNRGFGAAGPPFEQQRLLVRHPVAVRVAIRPPRGVIGFHHRDAIVERKDHAGQVQAVHEYGGPVHDAVAVFIDQALDPSVLQGLGSVAGGILHVAAHLRDVHRAVAIPHREHWLLHHRLSGFFQAEQAEFVRVLLLPPGGLFHHLGKGGRAVDGPAQLMRRHDGYRIRTEKLRRQVERHPAGGNEFHAACEHGLKSHAIQTVPIGLTRPEVAHSVRFIVDRFGLLVRGLGRLIRVLGLARHGAMELDFRGGGHRDLEKAGGVQGRVKRLGGDAPVVVVHPVENEHGNLFGPAGSGEPCQECDGQPRREIRARILMPAPL